MARPRRHYGKWRIRWVDEHRGRHSETFDTFDEAVFAQQQHELEVKEFKRGLRGSIQTNKTLHGTGSTPELLSEGSQEALPLA